MNLLLFILVFIVMLFIYLHINQQLNVVNELDFCEVMTPSKENLETICNLKQPFAFLNNLKTTEFFSQQFPFELKTNQKNIPFKEFMQEINPHTQNQNQNNEKENSKKSVTWEIFSENNNQFLEQINYQQQHKDLIEYMKPPMNISVYTDFLSASQDFMTPLQYEINFRNFFLVTDGEITVKLIPPKYSDLLEKKTEYENMKFYSDKNLWIESKNMNIEHINVPIKKNQIIYIPPYWWYSIKFTQPSAIISFKYRTVMNYLAISNHLLISLVQKQNITHKLSHQLSHQISHQLSNKLN